MSRMKNIHLVLLAFLLSSCFLPFDSWSACAPAPTGMVSWWGGDNNALDIIGTNKGTLQSTATFAPGMVGQAFSMDGVDDYMVVPHNTSLNPTTGQITVDAWVKPSSHQNGESIVNKRTPDNIGGYTLELHYDGGGRVNWYLYINGDWRAATSSAVLPLNLWTHVAGTYDGTTIRLYFDGGEVGNTPFAGSINPVVSDLQIGRNIVNSLLFNGLIDEVEIFNRALSASEIAAIYNAGSAGKCRPCTPPPSGLVSWWRAEGDGKDFWNGNQGTIKNGVAFAAGEVGQAFSFDGIDGYVFVPNALNIDGGPQVAYTAWVYPKATPDVGNYFGLLGVGDSTKPVWTTQQCRLVYWKLADSPPDTAKFYMDCGTNDADPSHLGRFSAKDYPIDQWHLVAGVFNNGALDIYVNGILDNGEETGMSPGTFINTNADNYVWMGAMVRSDQSSFFVPFGGLIDEAAIYNRALTANEIAAIFNAGSAGICAVRTIYLPLILKN